MNQSAMKDIFYSHGLFHTRVHLVSQGHSSTHFKEVILCSRYCVFGGLSN